MALIGGLVIGARCPLVPVGYRIPRVMAGALRPADRAAGFRGNRGKAYVTQR
jgi:hypothetical protein